MTNRQLFLNHIGQTSPDPIALEIVNASGSRLTDVNGKEYIDLIGGISVCNIGHAHKKVTDAISRQAENFMHVMVNGEFILSPQTAYAKALTDLLPQALNSVFFTASGTEATEGAMKLAKRYTGRTGIVAFKNSYHGSTQGSLSIIGDEYWRNAFRPLLPGIRHLDFNSTAALEQVNEDTACVIAETIQAEAGVIVPDPKWLQSLREACDRAGALLVLDEIQCGFGRNGSLWAFEQFGVVPDILLLGKALGGGMPLGAFISDKKIMNSLSDNPVLGHINTFGGHPVCCAAGHAALQVLLDENLIEGVFEKEKLIVDRLSGLPALRNIRSRGLMMALEFEDFPQNKKVIDLLLKEGVFTDWFLFASNCLRIAPPLVIEETDLLKACSAFKKVLTHL